ncbi:MAG: 16S rRNA (guanine(966)-N(2))-methyltransferase RsmD [Clostridia bacterium]|nr:16S rRNA (guanine(966)-N(2))-methyltransferase RsmD [Clostridia bacterium]
MVRIISGTARGRKIETREGMETRPTLDRVKEAIFGSVQFSVPYAEVLDLFSGSGNLGLEACSRGAKLAVLNDRDAQCTAIIRRNAETLGFSDRVRVLNLDYAAAIDRLRSEGASFDLAFLDPPYREGISEDAVRRLFESGLIKPDGLVILEHAADLAPQEIEGVYRVRRSKKFGRCGYSLIEEDRE